jgi:hypothetical protein
MSSLTVDDSESSFLKGKAEFDDWYKKWQMQWYMPQIINFLGALVNNMPLEEKLQRPQQAFSMEKNYRKLRGG